LRRHLEMQKKIFADAAWHLIVGRAQSASISTWPSSLTA
jgi:hypothetical protein